MSNILSIACMRSMRCHLQYLLSPTSVSVPRRKKMLDFLPPLRYTCHKCAAPAGRTRFSKHT